MSDLQLTPASRDSGAPLQIRQKPLTLHRPPSSPISPSQQLPSLLDVDQLKQECHSTRISTRIDVTEHELPTEQNSEQNVELVRAVPWRVAEEADYPTVFSCSSTSRMSATDLGTSRYKATSQAENR